MNFKKRSIPARAFVTGRQAVITSPCGRILLLKCQVNETYNRYSYFAVWVSLTLRTADHERRAFLRMLMWRLFSEPQRGCAAYGMYVYESDILGTFNE